MSGSAVIGAGIGGFAAIAAQPTYGGEFETTMRTIQPKSGKMTWDPHPVQGGPYIADSNAFDQGAARVLTWLDAKGTLEGDMKNSGAALLLATALGSSATLTQLTSTTAYALGGSDGAAISFPDLQNGGSSGCCVDMQFGVPDAGSTMHAFNFHSCMITKATWTFERSGLVTYSYDLDAQYVETESSLITPSESMAAVPFAMANVSGGCDFLAGSYGSEAHVDGIKKITVSIDRKLATERIYVGNSYKDVPVTNANVGLSVTIDTDYTSGAKTALWDLFLAGTPVSVIATSVGNEIGSSGSSDTFGLALPELFVDTGAEPNIDKPDIVNTTLNLSGKIDPSADNPLTATLITADTAF